MADKPLLNRESGNDTLQNGEQILEAEAVGYRSIPVVQATAVPQRDAPNVNVVRRTVITTQGYYCGPISFWVGFLMFFCIGPFAVFLVSFAL
mmetsp:Transcript_19645/g.23880  ORF Transcript_19645/g.23880 Transcript_19645/m.23880 type:complete len:92 (+) Transcript_19645:546-821(+)